MAPVTLEDVDLKMDEDEEVIVLFDRRKSNSRHPAGDKCDTKEEDPSSDFDDDKLDTIGSPGEVTGENTRWGSTSWIWSC